MLQIFEQQLQGFANIIANRQFYRFEDLKTGFVVQYGSPICKHWVADLQAQKPAQHLPDICPQQLRTNLPRSVSIEPVDINQLQARFLTSLRGSFRADLGHIFGVANI